MKALIVAAGLLMPASLALAAGGERVPVPPPPEAPLENPAEAALLPFQNLSSRMTVPVQINGKGPYRFIIDTGAERTVISRELAGVLRLKDGPDVRVAAITGFTDAGTVVVPSLSVSKIAHATIQAPELSGTDLGALGMLGLDALQGHAVAIDFQTNTMVLKPVKRARGSMIGAPGEVVVKAKPIFGQLIVTDAYHHNQRISVIIDTGSPISLGNKALLATMANKPPKFVRQIALVSATGGELVADYSEVDSLDVGGVHFNNVSLGFADAAPFERFGLHDTPALLLGMDTLRLFRTVQIDFVSKQIRFQFPDADAGMNLRYRAGRLQ